MSKKERTKANKKKEQERLKQKQIRIDNGTYFETGNIPTKNNSIDTYVSMMLLD